MKRLILLLLGALAILGADAQGWKELMEAGKSAADEKNYPRAIYFYEEALKDVPSGGDAEIILHMRLQQIYRDAGRHADAVRHGDAVIAYKEAEEPDDHFGLMMAYVNHAIDYFALNDKEGYDKYASLAYGELEADNIPDGEREKMSFLAAVVFRRAGRWDKVAELSQKAIEICNRSGQFNPVDYINYHSFCGSAYYKMGQYPEAYDYYKKQADLSKQYYGEDSQEYRYAAYSVAQILAFMGDIDKGSRAYSEVASAYRDKLQQQLRYLPSGQREAMLGEMIMIMQNMVPYGAKAGLVEDGFTVDMYNSLLLTKGLLLASDRSAAELVSRYGTEEVKSDFNELNRLKSLIVEKEASPDKSPSEIMELSKRIKAFDAGIAEACREYGDVSAFASVDYEAVKSVLGDGDVLLDFYDYKPASEPHKYLCFEIRRNQRFPKLHHVFYGERLDSVLQLENNIWSNLYSGEGGDDLSRLIGTTIDSIAGDAGNVYYVPSGAIHRLALDAIPLDGKILGDRHSFRRLSSARELLTLDRPRPLESAALFGGLDFNAGLASVPEGGLAPLPQSKKEVEDIEAGIHDSVDTFAYTDKSGTEAAFFSVTEDEAPSILHFSTHGFFFDPKDSNIPNSLKLYNDAMSLSGLVMAGGNAGWTGTAPSEGILNGTEIAGCDLSDVALASIASCHSGEGKITPEGIYGLQRAFKKAGVNTLVLSLWEVSDAATKEFMTAFYTDLVNGSHSPNKAFLAARNHVRSIYPEPYYWAPFILVD